jgi:hypothetical protein
MTTLPVENYSPERGIMEGFKKMNYAVIDHDTKQTAYPAWQFVDPAPEVLPEVMKLFLVNEAIHGRMHGFLVTSEDSLNELAPAEVLVGKTFPKSEPLHSSQLRILNLPQEERLRRVLEAAEDFIAEITQ